MPRLLSGLVQKIHGIRVWLESTHLTLTAALKIEIAVTGLIEAEASGKTALATESQVTRTLAIWLHAYETFDMESWDFAVAEARRLKAQGLLDWTRHSI